MGLFRQSQNQKPSSSSSSFTFFNPNPMLSNTTTIPIDARTTSSAQSVRSTHSSSTVKATSPPISTAGVSMSVIGAETGSVFPYPVGNGKPSTFHNDHDTDMDDPFTTPQLGHQHKHGHQRHRIDSQGVPIPPIPPRASSMAQAQSSFSSTTSLPSVQVTIATPTKQRVKDEQDHADHHHHQHHSHPYQQGGYAYSSSFGSGSLDITDGYTGQHDVGSGAGGSFTPQVPYHYSSSTDQLTTSYTSMEEESDSELQVQDQERKRKEEEEAKKERQKRMGRDRQRKKRQKDRAELEAARAQIQAQAQAQAQAQQTHFHPPNPYDQTFISRHTSTPNLGLAPVIVPSTNLSIIPPPSSASSIYSSLPNSASFPSLSLSLSPNTQHTSQQTSGQSSPSTLFSPITPAITSASALVNQEQTHPWYNTPNGNRASKSAVDLRSSRLSISTHTHRPPSSISKAISKGKATAKNTHSPSTGTGQNSAKRRRSEPEPEPFKAREVGLGVVGVGIPEHAIAQGQEQGQGAVEFLSTPPGDIPKNLKSHKERPGIRRTASDSAAVALDFTGHPQHLGQSHMYGHAHAHGQGQVTVQRSPTPPLLDSLKTEHLVLDEEMPISSTYVHQSDTNSGLAQADLLASIALHALIDNTGDDVQRALAELKFTRESLMGLGLQSDLAGFFRRYSLEKEMGAVSLEERPFSSYPAHMSNTTTPYHGSVPLSTTSTRPPSPSHMPFPRSEMITPAVPIAEPVSTSTIDTRASASKAIGNSTKTPSRARSLSSASMRARGLKMSSTSSTTTKPVPGLSLYQETLVSPMTTTPFQFPHPHPGSIPMSMVDSDGVSTSASPMMSSVQTPTTGQGAFPHHEILAIGQGAMRLDQGRAHHLAQDGDGRNRTMTDPGKIYNGHHRHGSNWEQGHPHAQNQNQHRSSVSYSQPHTMSALSSPLDMSFPQGHIPAPPPHLPPSFAYVPVQTPYTPSNSGQRVRSHTSTGLSTPFTPTPLSHRTSVQGIYQPIFTPIAEIGNSTRTRPSTTGGGLGSGMNPHTQAQQAQGDGQMVPEGSWMAFGHGHGQLVPSGSGTASGNGSGDPFGGNINTGSAPSHGHP